MRPAHWLLPAMLAGALLTGYTTAQEPEPAVDQALIDTEAEEVRRYTVELIIFEYADSVSDGGELFLPDAIPQIEEMDDEVVEFGDATTDFTGLFEEPEIDPEQVPLDEIIVPSQVEMVLLEPDDYTMNRAYERLQTLDAYRPVMHAGWTQATADRELAPPIRLRVLGSPPLYMDGTLTLYLSRYLHLVVDLELQDRSAPTTPSPQDEGPVFGDRRSQSEFGYFESAPAAPPVFFRINEDRIVKNGDLRYFDHPKFGVLAKVSRYEVPEGEVVDPGDDTTFILPGNDPR